MAISYIGNATDFDSGGAALSINPSDAGTINEDDIYVLTVCCDQDDVTAFGVGGGGVAVSWTELDFNGTAAGRDMTTAVYYARRGTTSLTNISVTMTGDTDEFRACLDVFRGVDTTTALDVTYATADHHTSPIASLNPTNDPITTSTNNAWVMLIMVAGLNDITAWSAPTNYDLRTSIAAGSSFDTQTGTATREITTAGTETPGAWSNSGSAGTALRSHVYTIALKPASGTPSTEANAPTASATVTGYDATVTAEKSIVHEKLQATRTLWAPTLSFSVNPDAPSHDVTVTGYAASASIVEYVEANAPNHDVTVTGYDATVEVVENVEVNAPSHDVAVTGYAASATAVEYVEANAPSHDVAVTGYDATATVVEYVEANAPSHDVAVTGYLATVSVVEYVEANAPGHDVVVTGYAATASIVEYVEANAPSHDVAVVAYGASVTSGGETNAQAESHDVTVTAYAATAQTTTDLEADNAVLQENGVDELLLEDGTGLIILETVVVEATAPTHDVPVTGYDAGVSVSVGAPNHDVAVTAYNATVVSVDNIEANAPSHDVTVTAYDATVSASGDVEADAPYHDVTVTSYPATVTTSVVTLEGFRWRNDDGTETTATWAAAQDTTITVNAGDLRRLRLLLDATNDPDSSEFTLQFKKVGDPTWTDVS